MVGLAPSYQNDYDRHVAVWALKRAHISTSSSRVGIDVYVAVWVSKHILAWRVQGLYQEKPPLPFVPGSEVSGTVIEVGAYEYTMQSLDYFVKPIRTLTALM